MTKVRMFIATDDLVAHLEELGGMVSVEDARLTELDHGLQCAALLARDHADDVELQIAGLVHDLAHPWDEPGQGHHAAMGAAAVRQLLGERVAAVIGGHVAAKRYLVTVDPRYRLSLSPDSIDTLGKQGGDMTADEVRAFEARPHWRDAVQLRIADDSAKVPEVVVPGLSHWVDALRALT